MLPKFKKGSGQGLIEYALILVLVAIVVIAALMVIGPIIESAFSENSSVDPVAFNPNYDLLSGVRVQYGPEEWSPTHLPLESITPENSPTVLPTNSCVDIYPPSGQTIKVGTTYEDVRSITVSIGSGGVVTICNTVIGADPHVYIAYVNLPR